MDVSAATAAASQTTTARSTLSGNFDTFLRLLTTQLQNQDPLEPLDATKFTEQLVSYSQVEQQISTNANLESLLALTKAGAGSDGRQLSRQDRADRGSDFPRSMTARRHGATSCRRTRPASSCRSSTPAGKVVRTLPGVNTVGTHDFVWDGINGLGNAMPEGSYKLAVNARKADGTPIATAITGVGLVKEVDMSGAEPMVTIANRIVKLSEILGLKN